LSAGVVPLNFIFFRHNSPIYLIATITTTVLFLLVLPLWWVVGSFLLRGTVALSRCPFGFVVRPPCFSDGSLSLSCGKRSLFSPFGQSLWVCLIRDLGVGGSFSPARRTFSSSPVPPLAISFRLLFPDLLSQSFFCVLACSLFVGSCLDVGIFTLSQESYPFFSAQPFLHHASGKTRTSWPPCCPRPPKSLFRYLDTCFPSQLVRQKLRSTLLYDVQQCCSRFLCTFPPWRYYFLNISKATLALFDVTRNNVKVVQSPVPPKGHAARFPPKNISVLFAAFVAHYSFPVDPRELFGQTQLLDQVLTKATLCNFYQLSFLVCLVLALSFPRCFCFDRSEHLLPSASWEVYFGRCGPYAPNLDLLYTWRPSIRWKASRAWFLAVIWP